MNNIQKAEQIAILEGYQPMPQKNTQVTIGYRSFRQFPVKGFPEGLEIFQTSFNLEQLLQQLQWTVHVWEPGKQGTSTTLDGENTQGYQRRTELTRAIKFGNFTKYENNCLSSYYFAIRKTQANSNKVKIDRQNKNITIEPDCIVYCVDGAHRAMGLLEKLDDFKDKDGKLLKQYADYEIPVLMTIGLTKMQEAEYFVIMNDEQRKVRTDLGHRLIAERTDLTVNHRRGITLYKDAETVKAAYAIYTQMNKKGVFEGRILPPNAKRPELPNTTISERMFERSLDTLLKGYGTFQPLSEKSRITTLEKYWSAIKQIVPELFVNYNEATDDNPNDSCIQQPIGVMSLHIVLQNLAHQLQKRPEQFTKEEFVQLLDVPCISKAANWLRPNGHWTMFGTNMKAYTQIAQEILKAIKKHKASIWNKHMRQ